MLYLIGLGIELKDLSLKALELIKKCKTLYLESYTSTGANLKELRQLIKKPIIVAQRDLIEDKAEEIIKEAKKQDIGILVYGDPLIATTHINFLIEAKKLDIKIKIVHNISIINLITETGLMLYNFGKTTSIPFDFQNIKTPLEVIKNNLKLGLHTLVLLDLDPKSNKFLSINEVLDYLKELNKEIIACSALGTKNQDIKYEKINELIKISFNKFPQCIVVPGKLHFREEEALKLWK